MPTVLSYSRSVIMPIPFKMLVREERGTVPWMLTVSDGASSTMRSGALARAKNF